MQLVLQFMPSVLPPPPLQIAGTCWWPLEIILCESLACTREFHYLLLCIASSLKSGTTAKTKPIPIQGTLWMKLKRVITGRPRDLLPAGYHLRDFW
ncbi:hypothetical protein ACOMHN_029018 [Nucella lapillus]